MRIGFLSDLHITHNTNLIEQAVDVVIEVCKINKIDKLFIAGDTSNNYRTTLKFIEMLINEGIDSYTIFGNHEYWSISYKGAQKINNDRYINGKVVDLDNNSVIIGMDGTFDYSFITDVDNPYTRRLPVDKRELRKHGRNYFDLDRNKIKDYNEAFKLMEAQLINNLQMNKGKDIIIMTHYVPSEEFVLYNEDVIWTTNNAFMGSKRYQKIAEEYKVSKVIFGHTHTKYNRIINGVSYHCNPVGYGSFEFEETFRERVSNVIKMFDI